MDVHQGAMAWHKARAHSIAADEAFAAYERGQVAMRTIGSAEEVDAGFNVRCDASGDALEALMATPAPTIAAAADKLARFMWHEVYANVEAEHRLGFLLADLERLAAREADPPGSSR